jgi:hypothetical protein
MNTTLRTLIILGAVVACGAGTAAAQTAQVQVIHNSPDPAATIVDIYLNEGDEPAIPDFAFRTATGILDLPAGVELRIGVAPGMSSGPGDILATFPVTLTAGESYVVMATGVLDEMLPGNPEGADTAFTLKIFSPLVQSVSAGDVGLLVYHGSPDAPTVDVLAVGVGILVDDLAYGEFSDDYLAVPENDYTLQITPGDDNDNAVASFSAPLTGLGGGTAVVFASGYLSARLESFGLFAALNDGSVIELPPTTVPTEERSWSDIKSDYR